MCAVSTNLKDTAAFGISDSNVFGFWDWVGGRYSVTSAVGIVPLSLHFGFKNMRAFLDGAGSIDDHFYNTKEVKKNIPLLLGLLGFFRTTIQGHYSRAILPYAQALCRFAPHIQQLDMESNGKRVNIDGNELTYECAPINFGEPGTNGQHSFYQLIHQGRVIPCEFIGFIKNQTPVDIKGESVSNHDELMSNFFSQVDDLYYYLISLA
jgi:glucose-6-phosphate isomerase